MLKLARTINVPGPASSSASEHTAAVCRYVSDFANLCEWDPAVVESRRIDLGPLRIGTRAELLYQLGLAQIPMTFTIEHWDPPHRVVLRGEAAKVTTRDEILFRACGGGTEIDYRAEIVLSPSFGDVLLKPLMQRVATGTLAGLRRALTPASGYEPTASQRLRDRTLVLGLADFTRLGWQRSRKRFRDSAVPGPDWHVVLTGATSGLGLAAVEALCEKGCTLTLVGRHAGKLRAVCDDLRRRGHDAPIDEVVADLATLPGARRVVDELRQAGRPIDALVNNAGALHHERHVGEGIERHSILHALSPYLLARALAPQIREGTGRVVNVSSGGMYTQRLRVESLAHGPSPWSGTVAYAQAKRAQVVLSQSLAQRLSAQGIAVHSMHPGWADTPGVRESLPRFHRITRAMLRSPRQGADTAVWLATTAASLPSGRFWLDRTCRNPNLLPATRTSEAERLALEQFAEHAVAPQLATTQVSAVELSG